MKKISIAVLSLSVIFFTATIFSSCAKKKSNEVIVKIGVNGDMHPQWAKITEIVAKKGIKIELVKFGDYVQPNAALNSGEIDLNAFQHYAYLNNEIKTKGYKIVPIAKTIIAPIGLYSKKIKDVKELKKGDSIAIPNDVVNGGRALLVLQTGGVIKISPTGGALPNKSDIISNPLNIKLIEVEAAQTPRLLDDVTAAFINGGHAVDAGINPARDSLLLERQIEGQENPYINIIAAREADKDNPVYKEIIAVYHSPEVKEVILKEFKGAYQPAWD
ncbi:MAG: MetQ/NlpA family ABC transporter substrate-binding protein [Elusimicrobiota bacterium]|jgi:D-methionine transport system substrate-binding protein|nr:MetQ/NlpA family ABC transporter substrate-binding protein [Elusimicrobiota bacterium]